MNDPTAYLALALGTCGSPKALFPWKTPMSRGHGTDVSGIVVFIAFPLTIPRNPILAIRRATVRAAPQPRPRGTTAARPCGHRKPSSCHPRRVGFWVAKPHPFAGGQRPWTDRRAQQDRRNRLMGQSAFAGSLEPMAFTRSLCRSTRPHEPRDDRQ